MPLVEVLGTSADRDRASVIETLEAILADARAGNISAIALAYLRPDGSANNCWSDTHTSMTLIGAITILQYSIAGATME